MNERVATVLSSYAGNHSTTPEELLNFGRQLKALFEGEPGTSHGGLEPAVPIKKSVTDDYIICLEDGKKFKTLRRHLAQVYNMTPQQYREKWGLPHDYPMIAASYARIRSQLARASGLGNRRRDNT